MPRDGALPRYRPPAPPPPQQRSGAGIAAICAAAALACLPLTQGSEGTKLRPYWDPAHIRTVCIGETKNVQERLYSPQECTAMLQSRMTRDYAPKLLAPACLPQLRDERRVKVLAALLDAAYNAGPAAVCKSRMARSIRAGDWAGACNGFYGWYTTARDRRTGQRIALRGLVIRREKEAALCREGLR